MVTTIKEKESNMDAELELIEIHEALDKLRRNDSLLSENCVDMADMMVKINKRVTALEECILAVGDIVKKIQEERIAKMDKELAELRKREENKK